MINKELIEYIQKAREKKIFDEDLISSLKKAGWNEEDIRDSKEALDQNIPIPPIAPNQQRSNIDPTHNGHLLDSFEHILMFISLYIFAVSYGLILHTFIDNWLPIENNVIQNAALYPTSIQDSLLRGYLSALIVSYPFFCFLFIRITKRTHTYPYLQTLRSRTILIYLTLIVTFIIMFSNIISIVNGLLNGSGTLNFISHFLLTMSINGLIFGYYLYQIKKHQKLI